MCRKGYLQHLKNRLEIGDCFANSLKASFRLSGWLRLCVLKRQRHSADRDIYGAESESLRLLGKCRGSLMENPRRFASECFDYGRKVGGDEFRQFDAPVQAVCKAARKPSQIRSKSQRSGLA